MEHISDPMIVTNEIGRVLRPGGRYYLSAPMCWHQHQKPYDFFRYTSFGYKHLLENSGMKIRFEGKGVVKRQSIPPGKRIVKGQTIKLELT